MNGNLKFGVRSSEFGVKFHIPQSAFRNQGFTYIAVMMLVVVIGIGLSLTGKYWGTIAQREKEEELLFRGDQIRKAIEMYYKRTQAHQGGLYPGTLDELLKLPFGAKPIRFLRRKYKDPMTGKDDWVLVADPATKRIMGVRSSSNETPIKVSRFPFLYVGFEGKTKYSDWIFAANVSQAQPKK